MKYAFSTYFDRTYKNLGVSNERHMLFFETAKDVSFRAVFTDKEITNKTQAIELYLNEVQPENNIEMFWAGFVFCDVLDQTQKLANKLADASTE